MSMPGTRNSIARIRHAEACTASLHVCLQFLILAWRICHQFSHCLPYMTGSSMAHTVKTIAIFAGTSAAMELRYTLDNPNTLPAGCSCVLYHIVCTILIRYSVHPASGACFLTCSSHKLPCPCSRTHVPGVVDRLHDPLKR